MNSGKCLRIVIIQLVFAVPFLLNAQTERLPDLIKTGRFNLVEKILNQSHKLERNQKVFYEAMLSNAFGDFKHSDFLLNKIEPEENDFLKNDTTLMLLYYKTKSDNYTKLYRYSDAINAGTRFLEKFTKLAGEKEAEAQRQSLKIWDHLKSVPAQRLIKKSDTELTLTRDIAKLWNIPVVADSDTFQFVFDTGAGMCTIMESYAKKLKLEFIEGAETDVRSGTTGGMIKSKLAKSNKLKIGNMEIDNAVFLVMPDSALIFAGGRYKINGIIGFPVIHAMEEITITSNKLLVPKTPQNKDVKHNLYIDGLKPVVYLNYLSEEYPYSFDTGADKTDLSELFYNKYKSMADSTGKEKSIKKGGAGGTKTFTGLEIESLSFSTGHITANLENVFLYKEAAPFSGGKFYGNIGQDFIRQFAGFTINFINSSITFNK